MTTYRPALFFVYQMLVDRIQKIKFIILNEIDDKLTEK